MKGGARATSGPVPDPNALSRDRKSDQGSWTVLPAEGRKGRAPKWPLSRPTKRELELWRREWRRPQAVMWQAAGQYEEVALYVRALKDAERPSASVAARTLVRQLMEALGISIPGMLRNRWKIAPTEGEVQVRSPAGDQPSAKERLKVVHGGG